MMPNYTYTHYEVSRLSVSITQVNIASIIYNNNDSNTVFSLEINSSLHALLSKIPSSHSQHHWKYILL